MFTSILAAVDGSAPPAAALTVAAGTARHQRAELTALTVAPFGRGWGGLPSDHLPGTRIGWGDVDAEILAEVERGGYDLLVLGSRGRGVGRATLLGSTGLSMLRRCPVPVLVARPPARPALTGHRSRRAVAAPTARPAAGR